jgi:hypothetical protein
MPPYVTEIAILSPLLIIGYQVYAFTASRQGREKQSRCQVLGIVYMSIGIVSLVFHNAVFVVAGFVMIMMGFRLMAHGLDRIDKKVFIDRYDQEK